MTELYIAVSAVLGLIVGLGIGIKGRVERDERIKRLEEELTIRRNVVKSRNEDNVKLRKERKNAKTKTD